jgi:exosome complex protein LRP1|tara:strand:+ start:2072 stop:2665 length:594 start_codon:yes stop_codon:yes gene_type:complete
MRRHTVARALVMATSEGLPDDARASVEAFERATREIEAALAPFLDADRRAVTKELRPLERAEVHCEAARAIATLFGMYLRTLGVDPEKHATSKELTRVEAYARKIEETRARIGDGARGASAGARRATASVEEAAKMLERGEGAAKELLKACVKGSGEGGASGEDEARGGEGEEKKGRKRAAAAETKGGAKKTRKGKK